MTASLTRKAQVNAARKRWRDKNKARVSEVNKAFYAANREQQKLRAQQWRTENPGKAAKAKAAWVAANRAHVAQLQINYRAANLEKRKADRKRNFYENRERDLAAAREWKRQHPEAVAEQCMARVAAKARATPAWANRFFIREAYHLAKVREHVCGGKWHVDHTVPLRSDIVCGLHCEANLQVIPGPLNQSKSNRYWPDMPV